MLKSKNIFTCVLFAMLSFTAYAGNSGDTFSTLSTEAVDDNVKTIDILINGTSKVQMKDVPKTGYLEVYSIIGVKVRSISLGSIDGTYEGLSLPKGLYILKAGKVALKVIVR